MVRSMFSGWFKKASFLALVKLSSCIKISYVFGSFAAFFSASNCIIPLAGAFGGIWASMGLFGFLLGLKWALTGIFSWHILAFYLPGLCASLYWASSHWFIRAFLPSVCMMLFLAHPEGIQAGLYTGFWLIPLFIYLSRAESVIARSFGSTFVAHGVGSVIWIYTTPLSSATWLALIPVVILERCVFALGMAFMHVILSNAIQMPIYIRTFVSKRLV